jgi:hypothetical protein
MGASADDGTHAHNTLTQEYEFWWPPGAGPRQPSPVGDAQNPYARRRRGARQRRRIQRRPVGRPRDIRQPRATNWQFTTDDARIKLKIDSPD